MGGSNVATKYQNGIVDFKLMSFPKLHWKGKKKDRSQQKQLKQRQETRSKLEERKILKELGLLD